MNIKTSESEEIKNLNDSHSRNQIMEQSRQVSFSNPTTARDTIPTTRVNCWWVTRVAQIARCDRYVVAECHARIVIQFKKGPRRWWCWCNYPFADPTLDRGMSICKQDDFISPNASFQCNMKDAGRPLIVALVALPIDNFRRRKGVEILGAMCTLCTSVRLSRAFTFLCCHYRNDNSGGTRGITDAYRADTCTPRDARGVQVRAS